MFPSSNTASPVPVKDTPRAFSIKGVVAIAIIGLLSACTQVPVTESPQVTEQMSEQIAQSCELMPEPVTGETLIGSFTLMSEIPGWIEFSGVSDQSLFNSDNLYRIDNGKESASFRIGEKNLIKGSVYLGGLAWVNGKSLAPSGKYKFYAVTVDNKKPGKTLTMVGDSITWWSKGRYMRCLLSKNMTNVSFTGPHTDTFGYGHAGEGGDKTFDIIKRLDAIKESDYYFLLAGTNDSKILTPEQSFENLKKISKELSEKGGTVIVSTLLPRLDQYDGRNQKLNKLLLSWNGEGCNCKVIDLYSDFKAMDNYKSMYWDFGLHPTVIGYKHIAEIISPKIESIIQ